MTDPLLNSFNFQASGSSASRGDLANADFTYSDAEISEIEQVFEDWDYHGFNPEIMAADIIGRLQGVDEVQRKKLIMSICSIGLLHGNKFSKALSSVRTTEQKSFLSRAQTLIKIVEKQKGPNDVTLSRFILSFAPATTTLLLRKSTPVYNSFKKIEVSLVPREVEAVWHHPHVVAAMLSDYRSFFSEILAFYSDLKGHTLQPEEKKKDYKANHAANKNFVTLSTVHWASEADRRVFTHSLCLENPIGIWYFLNWDVTACSTDVSRIVDKNEWQRYKVNTVGEYERLLTGFPNLKSIMKKKTLADFA